LSDIFVPAFNTGVMTFSNTEDERATWALGAFAVCQDTPPFAREDSPLTGDGTSGTIRGTWTPWYDEATQGRGLLHVGMGYRYENLSASRNGCGPSRSGRQSLVVDTRIGIADTLTGAKVCSSVPEIAIRPVPAGQYMATMYARDPDGPIRRSTAATSASYFLTGESRL
jgi:phosphate-selective porin OprO/OprP